MDDADRRLKAFLAAADRSPDEQFIAAVSQRVLVEQQFAAARSRAWRKFGLELLASGAVLFMIGAMVVLSEQAGFARQNWALSPGTIALLIFALWAATTLRAASQPAI